MPPQKIEGLSIRLAGLVNFKYTPPTPQFDASKVSGPLVGLIRVKEPTKTSIALEIGAGPKLHYIVVDSQETGRALLEKGELAQRVTFVPLSQIVRQVTSAEVLKRAQSLVGSENVTHALSLIDYKSEHAPAAEYAFGNLLVAQGPDQAKKVTFDSQVMTRTVTLEGDVFDPQGTLTGGSINQGGQGALLVRLNELQQLKDQLHQHEEQGRELDKQIARCAELKAKYAGVQHEIELASHALELLNARIAQTEHYQLVQRVAELERVIREDEQLIKDAAVREQENTRICEELEELLNNFDQATQLKRIAEQLKKTRAELDKVTKRVKKTQQAVIKLESEIEELTAELRTAQQQVTALEAQIDKLQRDVEKCAAQFEEKQSEYEQLKKHADKKRGKFLQCDKTIGELMMQRDKQTTLIADHDVQIKTLEHRISSHHGKKKGAEKRYKQLLESHAWIANEKQFFGKPKTDYDFNNRDIKQVELKLKNMEEEQDRLAKTINKKVMNMFSKAEQEYQDVLEKKTIVQNDKAKISAVIKELDQRKNETLKVTHEKVNKDFGSIFGTLLPGATAQLSPPEGGTVLDGLEVRVSFDPQRRIWKDSLSELSGGQKSLLALSLILALLLFKPAPMYILDEIDSALDLSHTQNIGQMLRTHFTHSQFIVVSLKEGMFNNANVVFRTKLVDGVSAIERLENRTRRH